MRHLISLGELLIDFIPQEKGLNLAQVNNFKKMAGGAPANVAAAYAKMGGTSYFVGQVGKDSFGDFLINSLKKVNVNTSYVKQSSKANTSLAFVTLSKNGERDFIFYRNPGADQLFESNQIPFDLLKNAILHFCSVSLDEYPVKYAHKEAIKYMLENDGFISFDPNLRLSLWENHEAYRNTILEFIPFAHLIKISSDELEFVTRITDYKSAVKSLFVGNVKYIVVTHGNKGAEFFFRDSDKSHFIKAYKFDSIDTTGAGDAFIGSLLYKFAEADFNINEDNIDDMLDFANLVGGLTTTKKGGMAAIPNRKKVITKLHHFQKR